MEELLQIEEPQQMPPPDDPPRKKLYKGLVKKGLYTKSYEDFEGQFRTPESIDKLYKGMYDKGLYTKTREDFNSQFFSEPVKKKSLARVDFEGSSLEAGNGQSFGGDVSEIPKIEMYSLPSGEMVEPDPISLSKKYNELKNKTVVHRTGGEGTASQFLPDEAAKKEADKLQEDFKDFDLPGIYEETKGLNDELLAHHGKRLMQERIENPQLYQRDMANLKWRSGFERKILDEVDKGNIDPDNYNRIKHAIETLPEVTSQGDYTNQRPAIQSLAKDIKDYGGENRDELLKEFAVEVSKVYGNSYNNNFSKAVQDSPESKYFNEDAQLGYHYIQDLSPEKAEQYKRLLIDPKTLKDKSDELKGYNHLMQTLEETGIGLQQNSVSEELNSLKKQAEQNGGLTEQQLQKATELEKKQDELSQKRNELDKKYPDRVTNKVDDAMQEIFGQRLDWHDYSKYKTIQAFRNTGKGIWEAVSTPFMSDESNNLRELAIMGEGLKEEQFFHTTDKNKGVQYDKMVFEPDIKAQIDAIYNDKGLDDRQKEKIIGEYLKNNPGKFGRVPIHNGKYNINPSSILYGLTDLGTAIAPFVVIEVGTGGIGGVGSMAKFIRTFTAAASTTFHDEYAAAISEGKTGSDAYRSAMAKTAINSFAMAGAGTPTELRAMAKGNSSAEKLIARMSDAEIEKVLAKGTPKGLKAFGQSLKERLKATPSLVGQGLKTGAKFEAYMAGANAINGREQNFKQMLLNVGNFGIAGGLLGHIGYKNPTELQKSAGIEFAKNPTEFIETAKEMHKDGILSKEELNHRIGLIEQYGEAYKTLPKENDKGGPLTETQKAEYLYNNIIKNQGNKGKSTLPPNQAKKAEHDALVADFKNGIILENTTDTQLEKRQSRIEKILEPKKDAEGNSIELPEKQKKEAEAELQAVKETIEERKSVVVEPPKKVAEEIPLEESKVTIEPPKEIPEPIKLNEPNEEPQVEVPVPPTETSTPKEEPAEVVPEATQPFVEDKRTILSHRGLQEVATEFGLDDVTKRERKTDPKLFKDAEETANKWMEEGKYLEKIERLVNKAEDAEVLTDEQRVILQQHIANVRGELSSMDINSPDYDIRLKELDRLVRAGEVTRSAAGAALRVPFMASTPNDLTSMMVEEMRVSRTGELTSGQKETVQKEYNGISTAEKAYQDKIASLEEENAKLRAGKKVSETKSSTTKTKKVHEDFVKERKTITESIGEKLKKARGEMNVTPVPYAKELVAIAPDVAKLLKSYVEEGVLKLEDITKKIYEDLKEHITDLREKDVHDIIAGEYNEKRKTKNEIAEGIENIRIQAKLVNKLEALLSGEEPKSEKGRKKRNSEIESLRQQIKDFRKERDAAEKQPKEKLSPEQQALKSLKTKMQNEAESLREQLRTGNYDKPIKKEPLKLDKEALKLRDEVIRLRQNREVRLLLEQRMAETGREKGMRLAAEVLNIPRTLMTIADYSALLRQDLFFAAGHPLKTAGATAEMFKQGWSQTLYDRWFADLKEDPRYNIMQNSKLAITDSLNHDLTKREESYMSSVSEKIPLIGRTVIKGSERSYTALLNKSRVDMFNYFADKMEARGVTYDNNPKAYKAMAEYINNATGRSDFGQTLNRVAPILNSVFFSPRLIASRVNMLTYWAQPRFWKSVPKEVRIDYMRNWVSLLAIGGTMLALAKMGGADVEDDPRSSDFGKIKSGNTRWDIWGGAQPYIRVLAQITTGKRKSTKTGKMYDLNGDDIFGETKTGVAADFFRNKLAPVPGAAVDILSGRTGVGDKIVYQVGGAGSKEISLDQYVAQRILPMTITGTYDAVKDRGLKALFDVGIPSIFGVGTQTYGNTDTTGSTPKTTKHPKPKKQD